MPWQQAAADVGAELLGDDRWAYTTVVVVVMRQVGKTTTVEAVITHRGQMLSEETLWMTAQNGKKARSRWLTLTDRLVRRLPRTVKRNIGVSHEVMRWVKTGCQLFPFAPGGDKSEDMHGEAPAMVAADEIWVFSASEWAALQQAYLPGMITKNAQEWLTSTQGTNDSEALNDLVAAGRELVALQMVDESARQGMCYIEYSIPPEVDGVPVEKLPDEQLLDLICQHNPAVGYTQTREALANHLAVFVRNGDREGFIRGYGNHRSGSHKPRVVPFRIWEGAKTESLIPAEVGLGIAVDKDGENVAVLASGRLPSGQAVTEVLQTGPGWTLELDGRDVSPIEYVQAVKAKGGVVQVAVSTSGAGRDLADQLEKADVEILRVGPADYAAACARAKTGVKELTVLHRDQPSLNEAMRSVGQRRVAGGLGWAGAGATVADAWSLSLWAVDHPDGQSGTFRIF